MTDSSFKQKEGLNVGFTLEKNEFVGKITKNVRSDLIYTNKDKLTLALRDHEENIKLKYSWTTSFGLSLSLLLTLLTTDKFKGFLGISAEIWYALVLVSLFLSVIYFLYSLIR
ncbi:hypothetical protein, partial [Rodentibacter caecimuris]|uniref:hypothetical protein n=1 Tax=Rodentibacter caecimuris TaxID=1796644 RepID=UPI00101AE71F